MVPWNVTVVVLAVASPRYRLALTMSGSFIAGLNSALSSICSLYMRKSHNFFCRTRCSLCRNMFGVKHQEKRQNTVYTCGPGLPRGSADTVGQYMLFGHQETSQNNLNIFNSQKCDLPPCMPFAGLQNLELKIYVPTIDLAGPKTKVVNYKCDSIDLGKKWCVLTSKLRKPPIF